MPQKLFLAPPREPKLTLKKTQFPTNNLELHLVAAKQERHLHNFTLNTKSMKKKQKKAQRGHSSSGQEKALKYLK